ncbi:DUF6270 domain-containing protein [Aeromonas hydrophila]|uniref:DUF6270 domain-containing protein n=1 Tax=Aeromonas hydrophila TaxID=644 RepID=UPI0021E6BDBA|nr:DUF6270 domain-containing protein [Aeromonas hydrophila]MCV3275264.1 DUF6270 domain-containing protein [Aeromonas hydrophila]
MQSTIIFGDVTQRVSDLVETRKLIIIDDIKTDNLEVLFSNSEAEPSIKAKQFLEKTINNIKEINNIIFNPNGNFDDTLISNLLLISNIVPAKTNVYFLFPHNDSSEEEKRIFEMLKRKVFFFYGDTPNTLKISGPDNALPSKHEISILGSCDSRDTLRIYDEIYEVNDSIKLSSYIARNSIACAFSTPIVFSDSDINSIDSPFIKKCVKLDLNKNAINDVLSSLQSKESILLIDFMDERFDLLPINDSFATMSWDYRKTIHFQNNKKDKYLTFDSSSKKEMTLRSLDEIIKIVTRKIPVENIYILNIPMATHYIDETGYTPFEETRYSISRYNTYLHDIISKITERHVGVNIISPPSWMIYGDKNHLWGAHPYHYNKLLYLFSAQEIFQK